MAVLFMLIVIGYIAGKAKMLSSEGIKNLSRVVINISTPSTILYSVLSDTGDITGSKSLYFFLMILLLYVLIFAIALPIGRLLGTRESKDKLDPGNSNRGLYCFMLIFGNVGFMGFPISQAIFGVQSMYYASLVNIVFNMLAYSIGIILISGKSGNINLKLLLNATFFAAIISSVFIFTGLQMPAIITETVRLATGINTPCAMLVIGATLSQVSLKDVFFKWRLYPMAFVKMVFIPVIVWFIFKQFVTDELLLGVLVILSGMPVAAAAAMLSIEYGGDERIASGSVFLTTLLSVATVPLIVYLLL